MRRDVEMSGLTSQHCRCDEILQQMIRHRYIHFVIFIKEQAYDEQDHV